MIWNENIFYDYLILSSIDFFNGTDVQKDFIKKNYLIEKGYVEENKITLSGYPIINYKFTEKGQAIKENKKLRGIVKKLEKVEKDIGLKHGKIKTSSECFMM
ncbi:MAG: hypothetical protein ABFQ65_04730, partial [Nanoarchaeota archaeon]